MSPSKPDPNAPCTLVLGGSGFLGAHLVAELAARGERVVSASREPEAGPGAERVETRTLDLALEGAAAGLLDELRPDKVALVAALSRVGDCERDPELARRLNTEVPAEVALACRASGTRLVHVSTDLVFGASPPHRRPMAHAEQWKSGLGDFSGQPRYCEEDPPSPAHMYGRTKAEGEGAILGVYAEALIVRLPLLFGPSFGRGLGASDSLLAALDRGESPNLFVDEYRTPLEVRNAARALCELLPSSRSGLLHVAGPDRLTRHELGFEVLRATDPRAFDRVVPTSRAEVGMEDRPRDTSLDASIARECLATPLLGVREALDLG